MRKSKLALTVAALLSTLGASAFAQTYPDFRPPAVPIVTFNPFLSIWSESDKLTGDVTRHWTHREHPLTSLIRVDGKTYRLMGNQPATLPAMDQTSVKVFPTRSIYEFAGQGVKVTLTFMTPALPDDLTAFSLPLSYVTWSATGSDGAAHDVEVFLSASGLLAVDEPREVVTGKLERSGDVTWARLGNKEQKVLGHQGDDARINWGYAYVASANPKATAMISSASGTAGKFSGSGALSGAAENTAYKTTAESAMGVAIPLGKVSGEAVSAHAVIAYDEDYAISFFRTPLRPYWNKDNVGPEKMLATAESRYDDLVRKCEAFDAEVWSDAYKVGGEKYAVMAALAYRQSAAGTGLAADKNGQPMFFTKENTSNGDIATVDVLFPMDPIWVLFSPSLAKATLTPVLAYAASDRWTFPCSPHDLGTYPIARGTDDGGEAMPVEESGNMLILIDALCQRDGNIRWAEPYWPLLEKWADYLQQFGLDPENQLCTDDFMGHLAHNANLSVKAIVALAAYGDLCKIKGDAAQAEKYMKLARDDAAHWMKVAMENGDHSVLAFDKPNTWSQKYNLVWDKILGLNVFPAELSEKETAWYKSHLMQYGLPLDSRTPITKTDWTLWSATLASKQEDFEALIAPLYTYLNGTPNRLPFTDGYRVNQLRGGDLFHARPVIGGVFIKMLADPELWKKYASRDKLDPSGWMAVPNKPIVTDVIPVATREQSQWQYTTSKPSGDWYSPAFNAKSWRTGAGGFGTPGTPGAKIGTRWNTADIWIRKQVTLPEGTDVSQLKIHLHHDEDADVYLNGVRALSESGFTGSYDTYDIAPAAQAAMRAGNPVTIAVHCHQTVGGQYIDAGLATVTTPSK